MSRPIPALGFKSRTDAIMALEAQGHSVQEIANQLGIQIKHVHALRCNRRARTKGERTQFWSVTTELVVRDRLAGPAARRGMTPHALARLLLETIIEDDMITAVLDDDLGGGAQ